MNKPTLFHVDGSQVALGERIGRGGEGEVYALSGDALHAVKIYSGNGGKERHDKIMAMVLAKLAEQTPLAAFPIKPVKKRNGDFAGFVMRKVSGHKPLFELYSPGARKTSFPNASYPFLVQTASNFANAVGAVHASGCVIGDINHSGILIAETSKVALIDADSFQVSHGSKQFLCRVGVPDYTPPELQGLKLNTVVRTQNHDNFGVAIVIFQLLFMGRHPFAGSYQNGDMPIERAIREHRFAYGRRQVGMKPPPAAPLLKHFPLPLGDAFEAAFGPAATRPGPRQWIMLLNELKRGLRACNANSLHHHWQGAPECPWCRMERLQGISLFLPPYKPGTTTTSAPSGEAFNLEAVWRAIEAISQPGSCPATPKLHDISPEPSAQARQLRSEAWKHKLYGGVAVVIGGFTLIANAGLWFVWIPAGWYGLAQLFGKTADVGNLRSNKTAIERQWAKALGDWQTRCGNEPFAKLKAELAADKNAYKSLAAEEAQRVQKYQQNRRTAQLNAYLDTYYIRRAKIPGIGPGKTSTLASYGIETAADLTSIGRVERVPGFGPTTAINLIAWRRTIESRFVYNPNPNQADHVQLHTIKADIARKAAQLRQKLSNGHAALSRASHHALSLRQVPDPTLQSLHEQKQQLEADLRYVHGSFLAPLGWVAAFLLVVAGMIALANMEPTSRLPAPSTTTTAATPGLEFNEVANGPVAASATAPDEVTQADEIGSSTYYAVRETNIRARASTSTPIVGKLLRGADVYGIVIEAEDNAKRWLKITSGPYRGYYVSAEWNLASQTRPQIDGSMAGYRKTSDVTAAYREPSTSSEVIRQLPPGTPVTLIGITNDGWAEVSLKTGTIAYVDPVNLSGPAETTSEENTTAQTGPAEQPANGAPTPPIPHQNLQSLITPDDYPQSAIYAREQGNVGVQLTIDASGAVAGCSVDRSSGSSVLDLTTCRLLKTRARFAPAQDGSGNSVGGSISTTISWVRRFD